MRPRRLRGDRQPEAESRAVASPLNERLEKLVGFSGGKAPAAVGDIDGDTPVSVRAAAICTRVPGRLNFTALETRLATAERSNLGVRVHRQPWRSGDVDGHVSRLTLDGGIRPRSPRKARRLDGL